MKGKPVIPRALASQDVEGTVSYPYLVFYVERDDHIDVSRVLHGMRDLGLFVVG